MLHAYQRIPQHIRRPGAGRIHGSGGFIPSAIIPRRDLKLLITMGPDGGLNALPHRDWPKCAQNLFTYSGDLTNATWVASGATKDDADNLTFTAQNDYVAQDIPTQNGVKYTISAKIKNIDGNTGLYWYHAGLTPASTSVTIDGTLTRYSTTITGDGGTVSIGIQDQNAANHGQIQITELQVTPGTSAGTYRMTEARQRMWDFSVEANHPVVGSSGANTTNDTDDFIGDPGAPLLTAARGSFGGVDDYLDVASLALAGDWSFTAIIKPDDVSSRGLFRNGTASPNISIDASSKVSYAGGSTIASTTVVDNQWQIIGITKVGTTITHYLNGVANGSGTSGSGNAFTALRIGYDGTSYYDGAMSLFVVHGRGLTATEESRMAYRVARQYNKTRKILGDILGIDPWTEDFSVDYGIN